MFDIIDLLDRWGKWCCKRVNLRLDWPHQTMLGKALSGMPKSRCGLCSGQRQVPGWRVGVNAPWITCPQCTDGQVNKTVAADKTNPAFIAETGDGSDADEVYFQIDHIYATELNDSQKDAIYTEYIDPKGKTQEINARKLGHTQSWYSKLLNQAYTKFEDNLN